MNVEQAWQAMQADLLDKLLPRRDALIAAGMHGAYVKDGTLRYWISKGLLRETGGRIHVGELVGLAKKMHSKTA